MNVLVDKQSEFISYEQQHASAYKYEKIIEVNLASKCPIYHKVVFSKVNERDHRTRQLSIKSKYY